MKIKDISNDNEISIYDGLGKLVVTNDIDDNEITYTGGFEYGNYSGFGIEQGTNYFYQGFWKNYQKHGFGYLKLTENGVESYYRGEFKKDKKEGYGYYVLGEESVSQGLFSGDYLIEGIKYDKENKKIYKGKFYQDTFVFGETIDLETGESFSGNIEDGNRKGYGFTILNENIKDQGFWDGDKLTMKVEN